jgi:hypothetical protein
MRATAIFYAAALTQLGRRVILAEYPRYGPRGGLLGEESLANTRATARISARAGCRPKNTSSMTRDSWCSLMLVGWANRCPGAGQFAPLLVGEYESPAGIVLVGECPC